MIAQAAVWILELIGTVSFAVSGALTAIRAGLDIFSVAFIGAITAFGGGILRDLLIGRLPPAVFSAFPMFLAAVMTAVAVFVIAYFRRRSFDGFRERIDQINHFFDAVGLGAFSVMGTETAFGEGVAENMFLSVVLGTLTGIGGGIIRDILTDTTPYVLKKHVYAIAAILGSTLYYLLRVHTGDLMSASVVSMLTVVVIRILAARYLWSLPRIRLEDDTGEAPETEPRKNRGTGK